MPPTTGFARVIFDGYDIVFENEYNECLSWQWSDDFKQIVVDFGPNVDPETFEALKVLIGGMARDGASNEAMQQALAEYPMPLIDLYGKRVEECVAHDCQDNCSGMDEGYDCDCPTLDVPVIMRISPFDAERCLRFILDDLELPMPPDQYEPIRPKTKRSVQNSRVLKPVNPELKVGLTLKRLKDSVLFKITSLDGKVTLEAVNDGEADPMTVMFMRDGKTPMPAFWRTMTTEI